jgi:hypothetical protein
VQDDFTAQKAIEARTFDVLNLEDFSGSNRLGRRPNHTQAVISGYRLSPGRRFVLVVCNGLSSLFLACPLENDLQTAPNVRGLNFEYPSVWSLRNTPADVRGPIGGDGRESNPPDGDRPSQPL